MYGKPVFGKFLGPAQTGQSIYIRLLAVFSLKMGQNLIAHDRKSNKIYSNMRYVFQSHEALANAIHDARDGADNSCSIFCCSQVMKTFWDPS